MAGLVDYAGLFPPASLDMPAAVRKYREYLLGDDSWALGRFVVPATRLEEFSAAHNEFCCAEHEPVWPLSVLATAADAAAIGTLAQGSIAIDSIELKAASPASAEQLLESLPARRALYVEFPPSAAPSMLPLLARFPARAKIRTGGVTADAFPSAEIIAQFLLACARARVAFKATAGLHHPLRGTYPLTYQPQSTRAVMHGFVNVFLAAVLARRGEDARSLLDTLALDKPSAFTFGPDNVRWLAFDAGVDEIQAVRRAFAISYGSCSFAEPVEEVRALRWL